MFRTLRLTVVLLALGTPVVAQQVYLDRAAFLAASGPLQSESFECFDPGDVSASAPLVTPAFTLSIQPVLASNAAPMNVQAAPNPSGPHATHGTHFVQLGATPSTNGQFDLTIAFSAPVHEFALTVTDFGEYAQLPGTLSATVLGTTYVIASNPPVQPDGGERFWGLRSPGAPFDTLVLRKTTQGDGIGIDELLLSDLDAPTHCESFWTDLGFALTGTLGAPRLTASGRLLALEQVSVRLTDALPNSTAHLFGGVSQIFLPFKAGVLVPAPDVLILNLPTNAAGTLTLAPVWPAGLPAGIPVTLQFWVTDPGAPRGYAASNAVSALSM